MSSAGQALSEEDAALARAAGSGIHRLAIPTPFLVGRVNCYLIEDDPLTLIDTGPNSGKSLDELERALAAHGHAVQDIGLIVLTHQHMDHLGLLEILARRSGAEVAAFYLLGAYLRDFAHSAAADDDFAQAVMQRHGVPGDLAAALGSVRAAFRAFGSRGTITSELHDGDEIELDVAGRRLDLLVSEPELARRRADFTPVAPTGLSGYGELFVRHVSQANLGCDFDFLERRTGVLEQVIH